MKAYTDIEQSKKLAKILSFESADMYYAYDIPYAIPYKNGIGTEEPCWSLAALLSVISDYTLQTNRDGKVFVICKSKKLIFSDNYDNPIDACVEMILKLNKQNLL